MRKKQLIALASRPRRQPKGNEKLVVEILEFGTREVREVIDELVGQLGLPSAVVRKLIKTAILAGLVVILE